MKSLLKFLNENIYQSINEENVEFKNLRVLYSCPSNYYVQVPTTYSESDIQIYIEDAFLDELPGNPKNAKKFFGKMADNIENVYFEYDSMSPAFGKSQKPDLPFNPSYDPNAGSETDIMQIRNMKYVIEFSSFNIDAEDVNKAKEILDTIFNSTISNSYNKYSITLSLNTDDIEFD